MKLNTIVELPDGRIGTICWKYLDGEGGVWGEHKFELPAGGFGDNLPAPEFMLREKSAEQALKEFHGAELECVGEDFKVIEKA